MRIGILSLAAFLCLALPAGSYADFYSYVDEDGVVHITNVPTSDRYRWLMKETTEPRARVVRKDYEELIQKTSARYGIDPVLVKAIVKAESDFNPSAVSSRGAKGLMQLMPETARLMGVRDIYDPEENVEGGIKYLNRLLNTFEWKLPLALAAYNAGESTVIRYGSVPPYSETQEYVKKVLHYYKVFSSLK